MYARRRTPPRRAEGAQREWSDGIGLLYALGVHRDQPVWDVAGVWTRPMTAAQYAAQLTPRNFRRIAWREGSDGKRLSARFAFLRVYVTKEGREPERVRDRSLWLGIEWRDGEDRPEHFHLSTLPRTMRRKKLVRRLKERWRIKRLHEDLKGGGRLRPLRGALVARVAPLPVLPAALRAGGARLDGPVVGSGQ